MTAYYNEIDPYVAQWLRNLIAAGRIAPGDVDERSILDVCPDDLKPYTQCHFFAGIGVWSYALRLAGWPDDRRVWTGSCPCQPFSVAGLGGGFNDERHLWPFFFHLIEQRHPPTVFGEQVASKDAEPWIDLVQTDMEALGYAFGAVPFPAAGVGAPHIRDRLYWVGHSVLCGAEPDAGNSDSEEATANGIDGGAEGPCPSTGNNGTSSRLGHHHHQRLQARQCEALERARWREEGRAAVQSGSASGGVADDDDSAGWESRERNDQAARYRGSASATGCDDRHQSAGPLNGFWRDADWLFCRDGKWRPVEPGTFPLAHGASARVGRLRAYGNAISPWQAKEFITAFMGCRP